MKIAGWAATQIVLIRSSPAHQDQSQKLLRAEEASRA